jgi:hypothetical protein
MAVERVLLVEKGRRVRAEAVRGGRRPASQPTIRSAFQRVVDFGPPSSFDVQQIADKRRAISAFGVGLAPSATVSIPEVPAQGKCLARHRGHNAPGTHEVTLLWPATFCLLAPRRDFESEPTSIVATETAWGVPAAVEPPDLFSRANTARHHVGISVGIGSNRR